MTKINELQKKQDGSFSKIIKAIEGAGNKYKDDEFSKRSPYISHSVEMLRFCLTVRSGTGKISVEAMKEMLSSYETILKGYLSFKPVKEGVEIDLETTDETRDRKSILESAMSYV